MKSLLVSLLLLGFISSANSAIIDNGYYTTDTNTGLDWLDLTETAGKTYDDVAMELGVDGLYAGYRYATAIDVSALITNYTGTEDNGFWAVQFDADANIGGLIQLLGNTYVDRSPSYLNYAEGMLATPFTLNGEVIGRDTVRIRDYEEELDGIDYLDYYGFVYSGTPTSSFLVRNTSVPESSSVYLLAFGLLGLFGTTRRKV